MFPFKKEKLSALSCSEFDTQQIRKLVKILVIDDHEDHFPLQDLKDDNYTIDYWPKVDAHGLQRLEKGDYDIIILDIKGVADPELTTDDGLGILERIKKVNPNQIIVAFSGEEFDVSKIPFWKLTDAHLTKPVTLINCKDEIDLLIQEKISIQHYWKIIRDILKNENVSNKRIDKLDKYLAKALKDNSINAEKVLNIIEVSDSTLGFIMRVIFLLKTLYSLCSQ